MLSDFFKVVQDERAQGINGTYMHQNDAISKVFKIGERIILLVLFPAIVVCAIYWGLKEFIIDGGEGT